MNTVFENVELQSINDNIIVVELNAELLLQTLKHYEKANSDGLNMRLQKKDITGNESNQSAGRNASLALFYSHINVNANTINHTFKIPVKILKSSHSSLFLKEPELRNVDLFLNLPNAFVSTYKRLDKFRSSTNDLVTIRASRRRGGFLGFVLEEENKFKATISWNEKLDIRKPRGESDSLTQAAFATRDNSEVDDSDESEDKEITVKLKHWKMASRIVANCKTIILLLAHEEACVLHCLLDESEDIEVVFYINGIKLRNQFDE